MTVTQYDLHKITIGRELIQQYSSEVFYVNLGKSEFEASPSSHESPYDQWRSQGHIFGAAK